MDLVVIGFSGRPVLAATGWKPPILYDAAADSAFLEASPSDTWSMAEIRRFEQESLLSLLRNPIPFKDGARLVYAHDLFLRPKADDSLVLDPGFSDYVPLLESYVALSTEEEALGLYRRWAGKLLKFAQRTLLLGGAADLALARAMRARYCTVPAPLHELSQEAFALAFASLAALGRPTEPLLDDAKTDFSDSEILAIKREGSALATRRGRRSGRPASLGTDLDRDAAGRGQSRSEAKAA